MTAIRTPERDGYEAVQLAFGADQGEAPHQSRARPPEEGRRAADAPRRRVPRRGAASCSSARRVTVEAFEVGARVKISGVSKGKGFQGTIKRHNFASGPKSHGSHNVRAPGSIGASATPARVMKGIRGPGQMGNKRVTQKGLEIVAVDAKREPAARARLGARARAAASWRCAAMPDAPRARRRRQEGQARRRRLRRPLPRAARAPERARRAGRAPARHGRDEDARRWSPAAAPSRGARRAPAAPAPAPAARRSGPAAASCSAPSRAPTPSRSTARSSARRCAARCRCTPSAARSRSSTRPPSTAPKTQPGARPARRLGPADAPTLVVLGAGGVRRRAVVPQPRARRRADAASDVGVTDLRRRRLAARLRGRARRSSPRAPPSAAARRRGGGEA